MEAFETFQLLLEFANMVLAKKPNDNQSLRLSLSNW